MPRGRAVFKADPGGGGNSPEHELWATKPEEALRAIAERNNAKYIEGSLVFAPGGRVAEALFETVEPPKRSPATKLFRLAEELDAFEFQLFVAPDRWKRRG